METIRRITEQVVRQMLEPEKAEAGTLVLAPSYIPDAGPVRRYLVEKHGGNVVVAGERASALREGFQTASVEDPEDKQQLMETLKYYASIVLAMPPLWMLKNITSGDDRGFFEQVFLRALLWSKNVSVVLDFERPKFKHGAFFKELNEALNSLEAMGAEIISLKLSVGAPEEALQLVTEAEVIDAHKAGKERIPCAAGAIITALAWDTAKELGISIDE